MIKVVINPKYSQLEAFFEKLPSIFNNSGEIIYSARNQIKTFEVEGCQINVKSFRKPIFINQIAYVTVRKSKAKRSYTYAQELIKNGFNTPDPIGYIEQKEKGVLTNSFYVSSHEEFDGMLRELEAGTVESHKELILQFARYTANLHEKQILHLDYSPGNILYKLKNGIFIFYLVDLNRMRFGKPIDFKTSALSLKRLWGNDDMIRAIAIEYAKVRNFDEIKFIEKVFEYRTVFWNALIKKYPEAKSFIHK